MVYPGSESGTCFHSNRSCRLAPAHEGMKIRSCDLVWRVGTVDSATPHPDPSGGQAPALHFLIPPSTIGLQFGTFRRRRAGTEGDWRAHPGSEYGTCFHSNRSCRLAPAHQGMKIRSCDLVWRVGTVDSATPHPDPSGGQAPALHFLIPPSTIGLQFGTFRRRRAGTEGDWRAHPGSEYGTCFHSNRSCRLAPAHQGMKIGCIGWWESSGVVATTHTSPLDSRFRGNDDLGGRNDRLEEAGRTVAGDGPQRYATLSTLGWCWDDDPHPGRLVSICSN